MKPLSPADGVADWRFGGAGLRGVPVGRGPALASGDGAHPRLGARIYKTVGFTWVKFNSKARHCTDFFTGLGYWTRANPEQCLLATRGKPARLAKNVRRLVVEPRLEHSRKPECVRERIERLVAGPYLELFAPRDETWLGLLGRPSGARRPRSGHDETATIAPGRRDWRTSILSCLGTFAALTPGDAPDDLARGEKALLEAGPPEEGQSYALLTSRRVALPHPAAVRPRSRRAHKRRRLSQRTGRLARRRAHGD